MQERHVIHFLERPTSLLYKIEKFYEALDKSLGAFSELITQNPNYPTKAFRITGNFYSELKKLKHGQAMSFIVLDGGDEYEKSPLLICDMRLRELIWEIYRDGLGLKARIEGVKVRGRKIDNAKIYNLFTGEQLA